MVNQNGQSLESMPSPILLLLRVHAFIGNGHTLGTTYASKVNALIGHNTVRQKVMRNATRPPTPVELRKM